MNQMSSSAVEAADRDVSAGIRDRADPRLVLADRVDQLYGQMWLGILATFAIGAIAAPFTYVLATFGNRLFTEIALLVPMFYAINVAVAYRLTQVFRSGYRLRHAYGKLTMDYSVLNQRLERQLGELEEARRQVEA